MNISKDFDSKEEFLRFIRIVEKKFGIENKELFEDELLKLIVESSKENVGIDVDEIENSLFDIIFRYATVDLKENTKNIKNEINSIEEEFYGPKES
jgi:hypothetical protein